MLRIPVAIALAVTVLLASCSAPSPDPDPPLPGQSTLPSPALTPEETQVAESPYVPCDDTDRDALDFLYVGEYRDAPAAGSYPGFLPLPSCLFEEPDQITAILLDVTEADFEQVEASIVAEQGAGVATDGQGFALAGEQWSGETVQGMYLIDTGFGVDVQHIAIGIEREG